MSVSLRVGGGRYLNTWERKATFQDKGGGGGGFTRGRLYSDVLYGRPQDTALTLHTINIKSLPERTVDVKNRTSGERRGREFLVPVRRVDCYPPFCQVQLLFEPKG